MYEASEPHFDWQAISKAIILFILSIAISTGLLWGSIVYFQHIEDWKQQQDNDLVNVKQKLKDVQNSLDIVQQDYLKDYEQLVSRQFYSETAPISFEERLLDLRDYTMRIVDKAKLDLQLFAANWNISEKSNEYTLSWITNTPDSQIMESNVNLNLASLHEGHILKFLDRFYSNLPDGLFNLKSCEITQLSPVQMDNVSKPYFQANCTFSWYIAQKQE
ncbi:hypothetical protein [Candidatus Albibeggiatoa sp. nov. NOAA]|uniref:hypothetical protein n=1 Tax=Candidatus Albibeggiatoa sp. nov. NOAA TaxID=3162724 RepID=UPI0032FB4EC8|nr:hypothetical protein [Thiotrichaceae bacterium]